MVFGAALLEGQLDVVHFTAVVDRGEAVFDDAVDAGRNGFGATISRSFPLVFTKKQTKLLWNRSFSNTVHFMLV